MNINYVYLFKKYIGLIVSIVLGIVLFEYAYCQMEFMRYSGSDNIIFALQLCMGCGVSGWNGIVFPILASLPMAINYVREYKSGYLKIRLTKQSKINYITNILLKNALCGGVALVIPLIEIIVHLYQDKGITAQLITEEGLSVVRFMTSFAESNPIGYILFQIMQVFSCGVVFSTFALGISAWLKNEFLTVLMPFAICILVAILSPNYSWDLLLLYCPNAYVNVPIFNLVVMASGLLFIGIIFFIIGFYKNEDDTN